MCQSKICLDEADNLHILIILGSEFDYDLRCYYEAKSLINSGHQVTVLTRKGNNYKTSVEIKEKIKIIRVENKKIYNLLLYDSARIFFWRSDVVSQAIKIHLKNPFDVVLCHNLNTLPIGIKLKKKMNCKLVYDAREIWGYMLKRDLPEVLANYYLFKEKKLIDYVDYTITVNKPLKNYFSKLTKKPISIVMNCKELVSTHFMPSNNSIFTVIYLGVLGKPRFLLELVDVMKGLPDVKCIIGGSGSKSDYINALIKKCQKVKNVEFIGRIPMEEVIPTTLKSDAVIHMIDPLDCNNTMGLANKQFEAMVCGRPVIISEGSYAGDLTNKLNCGLVIRRSKKELKKAIEKLRDNPDICKKLGENALEAAIGEYNWSTQEKKLVNLFYKIENS